MKPQTKPVKSNHLLNKITTATGAASIALAILATTSTASAVTRNFTAINCGTWDSASVHRLQEYRVGFSFQRPAKSAAYFLIDVQSIKGKTVTGVSHTLPGTTDFAFTANWTGHPAGQSANQYKARQSTVNSYYFSLNDLLNGKANPADNWKLQKYMDGPAMGYNWFQEGLHTGQNLNAWTYSDGKAAFQGFVNAGGQTAWTTAGVFDNGNTGQNYIWGSSVYTTAIVTHITTTN